MARSVISNTHFRGNVSAARGRVDKFTPPEKMGARARRARRLSQSAAPPVPDKGGSLNDFSKQIEPAIPLGKDALAEDSSLIMPLYEPEADENPAKAKGRGKKKAHAKKKTGSRKKASVKKVARVKKSSKKPAANSRRKAAKPSRTAKKARQLLRPGQPLDNGGLEMQARGYQQWHDGKMQQNNDGFHLSTITSCSGGETVSPWQLKSPVHRRNTAPAPGGKALQLYRPGGWLAQIGYWFRQSARHMLQDNPRKKPRDSTVKIKGQAMVEELNRLASENRTLKRKIAKMKAMGGAAAL